jgi:hypothetical protein
VIWLRLGGGSRRVAPRHLFPAFVSFRGRGHRSGHRHRSTPERHDAALGHRPRRCRRGAVRGRAGADDPAGCGGKVRGGGLRSRKPAVGGTVTMDVNPYHALAVYILVFAGLHLVVAPPSSAPALASSLIQSSEESTLIEVRHGGTALAAAAIEHPARRDRHQKLGILLSLALYPLLVSMGMNYLMANGVTVILLTLVIYLFGHWRTFPTAAGGGEYSPSMNNSEQAELKSSRLAPADRDAEIVSWAGLARGLGLTVKG